MKTRTHRMFLKHPPHTMPTLPTLPTLQVGKQGHKVGQGGEGREVMYPLPRKAGVCASFGDLIAVHKVGQGREGGEDGGTPFLKHGVCASSERMFSIRKVGQGREGGEVRGTPFLNSGVCASSVGNQSANGWVAHHRRLKQVDGWSLGYQQQPLCSMKHAHTTGFLNTPLLTRPPSLPRPTLTTTNKDYQ